MEKMKNVLTIAGSDSSGGAGIQADLKTFSAHGVFGMSVITAVTAQNTVGVISVQDISPQIISDQIDAVFSDIPVHAVKIGMVSNTEAINAIADGLLKYNVQNIVLDPVMVSKSGYNLLKPEAVDALINRLLPIAALITPNIPEAEILAGISIKNNDDCLRAISLIKEKGAENVLVKGGHRLGTAANDILAVGDTISEFHARRLNTKNTHGTGCTLSSAIASNLAKGETIFDAVQSAKDYISTAIEHSFKLGEGVGPVHHFYTLYKKAGLI